MAGFDEMEKSDYGSLKPDNYDPNSELMPSTLGNQRPFIKSEELGLTNITVKERPLEQIIRQIKGFPWKVNYYNNLSSVNDKTTTISSKLEASTQKYRLFKNITIWLENPLESNIANVYELEFTAIVNSGFIPFLDDLVEVSMMTGRKALFKAKEIQNMTYMQHDVYKVTFRIMNFIDGMKEEYESLKNKVVNTLVEDRNYITDYGAPILLEEDFKLKQELKSKKLELIKFYYDNFIDYETKFISLTATDNGWSDRTSDRRYKIVDEYLNDFFRSIVNTDDDIRVCEIKKPSYIKFGHKARNILNCIKEQNESLLSIIEKKLSFKKPKYYPEPTQEQSVVFLSVNEIVDVVDGAYGTTALEIYRRPRLEYDMEIEFPLTLDINSEYYIFSKSFYNGEVGNCTKFENMVKRFIKKESILDIEILNLIKHIEFWSKYEQFYVIPIIVYILTVMSMNTFSPQ